MQRQWVRAAGRTEKRGGGVRERGKEGLAEGKRVVLGFKKPKSEVIQGQRGAGEPLDSRPLLGVPARIV